MQITRSGELTLAAAQDLCFELKASLAGDDPVVLDLDGVTEVDLVCLQVLLAADRSFAEHGRGLVIRLGEAAGRAWSQAGFPARGGGRCPKRF